jgi:hypothetical protein
MSDATVRIPAAPSSGQDLDAEQLSVGGNTVLRERMQVVGAADVEIVRVLNTDPAGTEYALVVRSVETESAQLTTVTDTAIAAGASATLDSTQINSGKTGKLHGILVSSAIPFKATLQTVSNGVATTRAVAFALERTWDWQPPGREFIQVAQDAGAGLDGFRVVIDNLDTSEASDVYASFFYDEV